MSDSLQPHELLSARLLCPWDSPGKNTGVDCHSLLQGIFLTQGSNPHLLSLLHCQVDSSPLSHFRKRYIQKKKKTFFTFIGENSYLKCSLKLHS